MPEWFNPPQKGVCRWCGHLIWKDAETINKRRTWHQECLRPYWIVSDCRYAKREVKKRDNGICATCGKYCHYRWEWQCDHIKPLIDANGDISFWQLENLQSLCNSCHFLKTAEENSSRSKVIS